MVRELYSLFKAIFLSSSLDVQVFLRATLSVIRQNKRTVLSAFEKEETCCILWPTEEQLWRSCNAGMAPIEMHVRCFLEALVLLEVHPALDNESSCSPPFVMHFTPTGYIVCWVSLNRCIYLLVTSSSLEFNTSAYTPRERVLSVLCPLFEEPGLIWMTTLHAAAGWNMPSGPFTFCESEVTGADLSILIYSNLVLSKKCLLHVSYCAFFWLGGEREWDLFPLSFI